MLQPTPYKEVTFLRRFLFTKKKTLNLDKIFQLRIFVDRYRLEFIKKSCDSAHLIKCVTQLISHISQWNEQMVQYYLRNLTSNQANKFPPHTVLPKFCLISETAVSALVSRAVAKDKTSKTALMPRFCRIECSGSTSGGSSNCLDQHGIKFSIRLVRFKGFQ